MMKPNYPLFLFITVAIGVASYYLSLISFSEASFILYGNRNTIPLCSAGIITGVAIITLFTSPLWAPAVKRLIVDMYTIDEKRDGSN